MPHVLPHSITGTKAWRWSRNALAVLLIILMLLALLLWRMWQIRGELADIGWPEAPVASEAGGSVTVTWLGTTTLLFDDGDTQILIDGVFSRVGVLESLLLRPVSSDIATINYAMAAFGISRLAAIIPAHSHHDHAMDAGHVANRSSAIVLGSESTANIVRGAGVPVDQYQILADGEVRQFGNFTIRLIASRHAPIGFGDQEIFPGIIDEPLSQPARISDYRTGVAWSVFIAHPRGTALVQGSSGFIEGRLQGHAADVAILSVAGLSSLGRDYTQRYWQETVAATGAKRMIAVHHDDFTAPFGEVRMLPDMLDQVTRAARWIDVQRANDHAEVVVELPPFGKPVLLY